jgi:hypothetical protein
MYSSNCYEISTYLRMQSKEFVPSQVENRDAISDRR